MARPMFSQKSRENIGALLVKNQILTVHELFNYQPPKIVLRSLSSMHAEPYVDNLFSYARTSKLTTFARFSPCGTNGFV